MAWIDRAARRAAAADAPDGVAGLAAGLERRNLTRRQALKGLAAGAVLAGPASGLLTPTARGASCLRLDAGCVEQAEAAFTGSLRSCTASSQSGGLWAELRCRVQAQSALTSARQACRTPDHSRCGAGERCDGTTGGCVAGQPAPVPDESGPVGTGPCANDYPTAASLAAARVAIAAGEPVVNFSPNGCMRLERTFVDGKPAVERTTVAGTIVSEYVHTATGMTGRRDDDRDGFFESEFEVGDGGSEFRRRDPATRAVKRRETRTNDGDSILVVIEEHGEVVQQFRSTAGGVMQGSAAVELPWEGDYCGQELDAYWGNLLMTAVHRMTTCLEKRGLGDVANEVLYAGTHSTIVCGDLWSAYAVAIDAGGGARSGRIQIDLEANEHELENDRIQTLAHELLHYTSLGLHDTAHINNSDSRMEEGDRVYACSILCADGATSAPNKCHCATCLQTDVCDERCKVELECKDPDLGAVCPCLARNKWYPTYVECVEDCSSGLLCFGFSKCKNLSKKC